MESGCLLWEGLRRARVRGPRGVESWAAGLGRRYAWFLSAYPSVTWVWTCCPFDSCRFFRSPVPGNFRSPDSELKNIRRLVLFPCKLGRRVWMELGHVALEWGSPCASGVLLNSDGLWAQFTIYPYPAQSEPHLFLSNSTPPAPWHPRGPHGWLLHQNEFCRAPALTTHLPTSVPLLTPPGNIPPLLPGAVDFLPSSGDGMCSQNSKVLSHPPLPSCCPSHHGPVTAVC